MAALGPERVVQIMRMQAMAMDALKLQVAELQRQLDWFKRQIFGTKSERFVPDAQQLYLGQVLDEMPPQAASPQPEQTVPPHKRRKAQSDFAEDHAGAFFDASKVPVETITCPALRRRGSPPSSMRLSARRSATVWPSVRAAMWFKRMRPIIKRLDTQTLHCAPAPTGVLEGSRADVSFIAGVLVDKFRWHLPLYRQHQRLLDAGLTLSRPWLTQLVQQAARLLTPIVDAQLASILAGHVITMDETPIKAGQAGGGKMKATYFWPVYGDHDEVCFPHFTSRRADVEHDGAGQPCHLLDFLVRVHHDRRRASSEQQIGIEIHDDEIRHVVDQWAACSQRQHIIPEFLGAQPCSAWRATSWRTARRSFFKRGLGRLVRLGMPRTRHNLAPAVAVE